jgi:hypothetical protein
MDSVAEDSKEGERSQGGDYSEPPLATPHVSYAYAADLYTNPYMMNMEKLCLLTEAEALNIIVDILIKKGAGGSQHYSYKEEDFRILQETGRMELHHYSLLFCLSLAREDHKDIYPDTPLWTFYQTKISSFFKRVEERYGHLNNNINMVRKYLPRIGVKV